MKVVTRSTYICEICGSFFGTEKEALACENHGKNLIMAKKIHENKMQMRWVELRNKITNEKFMVYPDTLTVGWERWDVIGETGCLNIPLEIRMPGHKPSLYIIKPFNRNNPYEIVKFHTVKDVLKKKKIHPDDSKTIKL